MHYCRSPSVTSGSPAPSENSEPVLSHKKGSVTATDCGNDGNESVASSSAAPSDAGGGVTPGAGIDPATPTPPANLNLPGDRRPLSALTSNSPDSIEDYIRNWRKGSGPTTPTAAVPPAAALPTATSSSSTTK